MRRILLAAAAAITLSACAGDPIGLASNSTTIRHDQGEIRVVLYDASDKSLRRLADALEPHRDRRPPLHEVGFIDLSDPARQVCHIWTSRERGEAWDVYPDWCAGGRQIYAVGTRVLADSLKAALDTGLVDPVAGYHAVQALEDDLREHGGPRLSRADIAEYHNLQRAGW